MIIKRYKNIIGLCACSGCKNKFGVKVTFEYRKKKTGKVKIFKKFRICNDCAFEVCTELVNSNHVKWENE